MAVNLVQNADGSLTLRNEADGVAVARFGGPAIPSTGAPTFRDRNIVKLPLGTGAAGGGVISWQNPEPQDVIVTALFIDVTAPSAGACTVSFGTTATNGATSSNNLIDTLSVAAAGLFDNNTDKGVNGRTRQRLATGKWVTGSIASGVAAGLVGNAYIEYAVV
jgi:hypothetical protein